MFLARWHAKVVFMWGWKYTVSYTSSPGPEIIIGGSCPSSGLVSAPCSPTVGDTVSVTHCLTRGDRIFQLLYTVWLIQGLSLNTVAFLHCFVMGTKIKSCTMCVHMLWGEATFILIWNCMCSSLYTKGNTLSEAPQLLKPPPLIPKPLCLNRKSLTSLTWKWQ